MGQYFSNDPIADEAFVVTALLRMGNVIDLISNQNVVLGWMARQGYIVPVGGGQTITQPLLVAESGSSTWFRGMDIVSKDFSPGLTEAEYQWAWVSHPIRMERTTKWENEGPSRVMSVEETRFKSARITLMNELADKFVNGTGGREPVGIAKAIEAVAPAAQVEVIGGIDKSANTWWQNRYRELATGVNFGDNVGPASAFLAAGILLAMQGYLDAKVGTSGPNALFTSDASEENYIRAMTLSHALRSSGRVDPDVDPTPHSVSIFGRPVIASPEIPDDSAFWLTVNNMENPGFMKKTGASEDGGLQARDLGGLYCAYHPNVNMLLDGPRQPGAQHVDYWFWLHSKMVIYENLFQQARLGSFDTGGYDNWA